MKSIFNFFIKFCDVRISDKFYFLSLILVLIYSFLVLNIKVFERTKTTAAIYNPCVCTQFNGESIYLTDEDRTSQHAVKMNYSTHELLINKAQLQYSKID